jgi:hypothetical protein
MWNLRHKEDSETNIYRTDSEESLFENFEVGFPLNSEKYLRNNWRTGHPQYYPPMSVMTYPDLLSESQSKKMTVSVTSQDQYGLLKSPFLGYEESMITTVEMDLRFKPTSDFYIEIEPIGDENGYSYISFNENGMYLWSENNDGVFEYEYENITYSDLFHHKIKMVLNNQEGTFNFLIDDLPFLSLSVPEKKLATRVSYLQYYVNKDSGEQFQYSIDNVRVTRTKVNDFVDLDSVSGSIAAGKQTSPTFTVDATDLSPGSYEVMLELLSNDVNSPVTEIPLQINVSSATSTESNSTPSSFSLSQNYPNPFNPTTTITYSLPQSAVVSLKIYDITGKYITTLVDGVTSAGVHTVTFDAGSLSSGMYVYTLETDGFRQSRQMMMVK